MVCRKRSTRTWVDEVTKLDTFLLVTLFDPTVTFAPALTTMKFSSACLLLLAQPASAFVGQSQRAAFRPLNVVTDPTETIQVNGASATLVAEPMPADEPVVKVEMPKAKEPVAEIKKEEPKAEPVKKEAPKPAKAAAPSFFIEEKQAPLEP